MKRKGRKVKIRSVFDDPSAKHENTGGIAVSED